MDDLTNKTQEPPSWLELESVRPLTETRDITNLSPDSQKRNYPELIVQLSARRCGMKLRHALDIAAGRIEPKSRRTARVADNSENEIVEKGSRRARRERPASYVVPQNQTRSSD